MLERKGKMITRTCDICQKVLNPNGPEHTLLFRTDEVLASRVRLWDICDTCVQDKLVPLLGRGRNIVPSKSGDRR